MTNYVPVKPNKTKKHCSKNNEFVPKQSGGKELVFRVKKESKPNFNGHIRERRHSEVPMRKEPNLLDEWTLDKDMIKAFHMRLSIKTVEIRNLKQEVNFGFARQKIIENAPE